MSTTGWNLTGDASVGDTPGDADNFNDELIICPNLNTKSGGVFYNTPVNLAACNQFSVDFKFRIFDGNAADGLAFCFLANPPMGPQNGQGIGIPANPVGLMVVFDTYNNCLPNTNPKIEIRYGNGSGNYQECPTPAQPTTTTPQTYLRNTAYQDARIEYNGGNITVYVNGVSRLTGFYNITAPGYFGFTASTGGNTDTHSIKDVFIRYNRPPANAGGNRSMCSGDTIIIGTSPTVINYSYAWSPAFGLVDSSLAMVQVVLTNNTSAPIQQQYILKVDTFGNACSGYDTITVTVNPKPAKPVISGDTSICQGQDIILNSGINTTDWFLPDGTSIPASQSYLFAQATSAQAGVIKVVDNNGTCHSDTTRVTLVVKPIPPKPILVGDSVLCIKENLSINMNNAQNGAVFAWQNQANGLQQSTSNLTAGNVDTTFAGIWSARQSKDGCWSDSTLITIKVNPLPKPDLGPNKYLCPFLGDTLELNPGSGFSSYLWQDGTKNPTFITDTVGSFSVTVTDANNCQATSLIEVITNCPFSLYLPDVFTPNGDGLNDLFKGYGLGISSLSMRIYDRWGILQYEEASANFNPSKFPWWTGYSKSSNDLVMEGYYVWIVEMKSIFGESKTVTGKVYVMK